MSFFKELKRRNVVRVGIAYLVGAWLLMQFTDVLLQLLELPPGIGKYVVLALTLGFPLALFFAWAFELTPEGIKREDEVDRSASITPQTGRKLDFFIIGALALVVAWFLFDEYYLEPREARQSPSGTAATPTEQADAKSIAVLPFADMSEGQDQAWFADGLAEEILNAVARAPDILVASRTSTFAYKGSNTPIAQIAEELGVEHVLEGSVRRAGDRIRVTAQLIRASDGFHVWSENFDRDAEDIIAMQEELAVSIARALKTTMDPQALEEMLRAGTRSVSAYEHYLAGLSLIAAANTDAQWDKLDQAYEQFERARETDPGFAEAHALAARHWRWQLEISRRGNVDEHLTLEDKMGLFRERIQLAIATAPNSIDRQKHEVQLALVEMRVRDAVRLAGAVFEQRPYDFVNLDEYLTALSWLGDRATLDVVNERVLSLAERGVDWAEAYVIYAWRITGSPPDHDEFVANVMRLVQRYPRAGLAYQAHRALLWQGEVDKARSLLPLLQGDLEGQALVTARQACAEGRRSDAEAVLAGLASFDGIEGKATRDWHIYEMLGRSDDAARVLQPYATPAVPIAVANYLVYPQFDPTPFPMVMSIIQREGIIRGEPVRPGFQCPEADAVHQKSVAVLPFRAMSSGEDDGYFTDGLTEEILNSLAAHPELLVTARTSSFFYKDKDLPVTEIAGQLGVDHVVEGSVRRSGERVRITAQLIRADDGFHLWSQTYDRTLEDVFAVQEDIATNIAEALDVLLNDERLQQMKNAGIGNVEAFIAYQKGQALYEEVHGEGAELTAKNLEPANAHFDRALELAPGQMTIEIQRTDYFGHILYDDATGRFPQSDEALGEAMDQLVTSLESAHRETTDPMQRAVIDVELSLYDPNWSGLPAKIERSLSQPHCIPGNWAGQFAATFGWAAEYVDHARIREKCDPLSMTSVWNGMFAEIWAGRPANVIAWVDDRERRVGSEPWQDDIRYLALAALGTIGGYPRFFEPGRSDSIFPFLRNVGPWAFIGDREKALAVFEQYKQQANFRDMSLLVAQAWLGNQEEANVLAARMDARPGGFLTLGSAVYTCMCGAPWDIELTPNFRARIESAGFAWPPASPIQTPLKDW